MDFDPEMFGEAIGKLIGEQREELERRLKAFEARIEGMQSKLDKCVSYAGEWQSALDYQKGALVRRGEQVFIATKAHPSGGNLSGREGAGWERVF